MQHLSAVLPDHGSVSRQQVMHKGKTAMLSPTAVQFAAIQAWPSENKGAGGGGEGVVGGEGGGRSGVGGGGQPFPLAN